jgi:hypothetical protein
MGDIWIPDRAMMIDEVLAVLEVLEDDWNAHQNNLDVLYTTAMTAASLVSGIGAGLRGEELPQIDLGGLRKYWSEGATHPRKPHVPLVLKGRFKQTVGEKLYFQPLANVTKSGIQIQRWIHRAIATYDAYGIETGPLFRAFDSKTKRPKRATVADLDILFHDVMKRVQVRRPDLIPASVNVEEEYSVRRTYRRTLTGLAQNARVPEEAIRANNRWHKHMHSKGVLPSMDMIERYSDAKTTVEALLVVSESI